MGQKEEEDRRTSNKKGLLKGHMLTVWANVQSQHISGSHSVGLEHKVQKGVHSEIVKEEEFD